MDINNSINVIDVPIIIDKRVEFSPLIINVGKSRREDNWDPMYTDKIAAAAIEEMVIPIKTPVEQEIAIIDKLIVNDSKIFFNML